MRGTRNHGARRVAAQTSANSPQKKIRTASETDILSASPKPKAEPKPLRRKSNSTWVHSRQTPNPGLARVESGARAMRCRDGCRDLTPRFAGARNRERE